MRIFIGTQFSLATMRFSKNDPVAMLSPRVMRDFPVRIDDRALPHLDNAIAGRKSSFLTSMDQFDMCPLITMIVDIIGDLAEQDSFVL